MALVCCNIEGVDPPGWCRTHQRQSAECRGFALIDEIHERIVKGSCPSCARHAAKLDREGLAIVLCGGKEVWEIIENDRREGYRKDADAVMRWMEE